MYPGSAPRSPLMFNTKGPLQTCGADVFLADAAALSRVTLELVELLATEKTQWGTYVVNSTIERIEDATNVALHGAVLKQGAAKQGAATTGMGDLPSWLHHVQRDLPQIEAPDAAPQGDDDFIDTLQRDLEEIMCEGVGDEDDVAAFLDLARLDDELSRAEDGGDESVLPSQAQAPTSSALAVAVAQQASRIGLVLLHVGAHLAFADAAKPQLEIMRIHRIRKASDTMTLKATCRNRGHGTCVCWLGTNATETEVETDIVLQLMDWAAAGNTMSEAQHYGATIALKRRHGMRVK